MYKIHYKIHTATGDLWPKLIRSSLLSFEIKGSLWSRFQRASVYCSTRVPFVGGVRSGLDILAAYRPNHKARFTEATATIVRFLGRTRRYS